MKINYSRTIIQGLLFIIGLFLVSFIYNLFLLPNNLVVGGMTGLSVVVQELFGWNATLFIYISNFSLIFVSWLFLDKKTTMNNLLGSILYPIFITLTAPLATMLIPKLEIKDMLLLVLITGVIRGIGCGLVFRAGFVTGGGDIIMQLFNKYLHLSPTTSHLISNLILVILCGYTFGFESLIYSIILLLITNVAVDKILIERSTSKVFFIRSGKLTKIKDMISLEFNSGYTALSSTTVDKKNSEIIMVVIPNRDTYIFKTRLLEIDPKVFFIINDCNEVSGGKRQKNVPFLEGL